MKDDDRLFKSLTDWVARLAQRDGARLTREQIERELAPLHGQLTPEDELRDCDSTVLRRLGDREH